MSPITAFSFFLWGGKYEHYQNRDQQTHVNDKSGFAL